MADAVFPVTSRNRLKRAHQRGRYDRAAVYAVLDASEVAHVAYALDGQPYCTPTNFWRRGDTLYWHASSAGRMARACASGLPVCATVSHVDGLVLARSGFHHSVDYRAVMCFGVARLLADEAERRAELNAMLNRFYPGRAALARPISAQELKATCVVVTPIEEASAKTRAAGVIDDEADYEWPIWAGVIPVATTLGVAQPDKRLAPGVAPGADLAPYRVGRRLDEALQEAQRLYERDE